MFAIAGLGALACPSATWAVQVDLNPPIAESGPPIPGVTIKRPVAEPLAPRAVGPSRPGGKAPIEKTNRPTTQKIVAPGPNRAGLPEHKPELDRRPRRTSGPAPAPSDASAGNPDTSELIRAGVGIGLGIGLGGLGHHRLDLRDRTRTTHGTPAPGGASEIPRSVPKRAIAIPDD
jgi:hypothetical protein